MNASVARANIIHHRMSTIHRFRLNGQEIKSFEFRCSDTTEQEQAAYMHTLTPAIIIG